MTVCALPNSDLQTSAVFTPIAEDSIAALSPRAAGAHHDHVIFVGFVLVHR